VTASPTPTLPSGPANFAAQIGLLSNNLTTTYAVASATGVLPGSGCPTGGVLASPVTFPGLSAVPFGHHVWVHAMVTRGPRFVRALVCVPTGPAATPTATPTPTGPVIPGFTCRFVLLRRHASRVVFEAQDLDAPVTGAPPGDQPGVQTRTARIPRFTVFTDAGVGVNENLTSLVACTGGGFPLTLPGPAAYVTAACQPINMMEYATATPAGGTATDFGALTSTEGISPSATGALVAPNNTLSTANVGPHGTASDASTAGSHLQIFTGNLPTS
jgi:hypothetical protein